jgi:predicted  nucleic acid-binding Zn-ribbon protein/glutaredoxin
MAQQNIDIGTSAGDGNGDTLRSAFDKINDNFTELYSGNVQITAANVLVYSVNGQIGNVSLTVADIPNAASKGYVNTAVAGNIAVLNSSFNSVNANVAAANLVISNHTARISTLESNAASQAVTLANLTASKAYVSYVDSSIASALSSNAILANVVSVNANVAAANAAIATKASLSGATFTGNIQAPYIFAQGAVIGNQSIDYPNNVFVISDSNAGPFGMVVQNASTAANAVGVITVLADDSNFNDNLVAIGVNNSNYNDPTFPDAQPHEAFIFADGANLRVISNTNGIVFAAATKRMYMNPSTSALELHNVNIKFADGSVQSTAFGGNANIAAINANISAANAAITSLQGYTSDHDLDIAALYANAGVQSAAITVLTANAATQSISLSAINTALTLSNANAAVQSIAITSVNANVTAANVQIAALYANAGVRTLDIDNLYSNAGAQATILNTLLSNAASQAITMAALYANAAAQDASLIGLTSNSATQATQINLINANVSAANANIASLQVSSALSNVNISALQTNVGIYVSNIALTNANVAAANIEIGKLRANITAANAVVASYDANIGTATNNITAVNANVAAANSAIASKAATSGQIFTGNIQAPYITANTNIFSLGKLTVGAQAANTFANVGATFTGNVDALYQLVLQNRSTGNSSIGGMKVVADVASDSVAYILTGITGSNYNVNANATFGDASGAYTGFVNAIGANLVLSSNLNVTLNANTASVRLEQDGNFFLRTANLKFRDDTIQTTAIQNVPGLYANIGTLSVNVATLFSTTSTHSSNISVLLSNAGAQAASLNTIDANLGTATTNIDTLLSNAGAQASAINTINANVGAYQTYANANVVAIQSGLSAYQTYANANAAVQATSLTTIDANLGTASTNIATLLSNAAAQSVAIASVNANVAGIIDGQIFTGNIQAPNLLANANVHVGSTIKVGNTSPVNYPGLTGVFISNVASYSQIVIQNLSSDSSASGDLVITADDGDDENNYINLGMNSSNWVGTFADTNLEEFPHDGYLTVIGGNAAIRSDGNVFIAANSHVIVMEQDGDLQLYNANLKFRDGSIQTTAVTDVLGLLGNVQTLQAFQVFANANLATQTVSISALNANVAAANTAIAAIDFSALTATNANVTAANAAIVSVSANITAANVEINSLRGNITAANVEIDSLRANITAGNALSNLRAISSNVVPSANLIYDLGENSKRWSNIYANATLYLGYSAITTGGGNIYVDGNPVGAGTYGNTQVAQYLAHHNANVTATNFNATANIAALYITATANITGGNINATRVVTSNVSYTMGNSAHWTTPVSNVAAALDQLAARIYALENP